MVLGYDYSNQKRRWWGMNAPHLPAVLMATAVCRSNTDGIAQCGMSRATLEATGCWHRATTCSVLPQWPPGQQGNKQQSTNTPRKQAVLMAMAMHWFRIPHMPPAGSSKVLRAPARWGGIRRVPKTKNLQLRNR